MSKLYKSKAWLERRLLVDRMSVAAIAAEAQVTETTIRRALREHGIVSSK